jgi:hypothetical protein
MLKTNLNKFDKVRAAFICFGIQKTDALRSSEHDKKPLFSTKGSKLLG